MKRVKTTIWNLKASNEKWAQFAEKLKETEAKATAVISDTSKPFDKRYKEWFSILEDDARKTIGKTTIREGKGPKSSKEVKELQEQKKMLKTEIQKAENENDKNTLKNECI